MNTTQKKLLSAIGGLSIAAAGVFAMAPSADANTIQTSRTPFQWPNYLGTLTDGAITVADVSAETDLTGSKLSVDYHGGQYDLVNFTLNCLAGDDLVDTFDNRTSDYVQRGDCPNWFLGNALVEADFFLRAP